jgi:hypothetical protein
MKKSKVFLNGINGHENMEDAERSSHPRSHRIDKNVEKVQNMVHSDSQY